MVLNAHFSHHMSFPKTWSDLQSFVERMYNSCSLQFFIKFNSIHHYFHLIFLFFDSFNSYNIRWTNPVHSKGWPTVLDLVMVDIPKNLAVSNISSLSTDVLPWNVYKFGFLDTFFNISNTHLYGDGPNILFYVDNAIIKTISKDWFMTAYNFRLYKEWMGVNQLWMTSTCDIGKMIWKIYI
jgi:hypothetical protein